MKRSVLILLASVLILLTACKHEAPVLKDTFRSDIAVKGGELDFTATVDCSPGAVILEVTSPATVAGIRYSYANGELHTSYGSLDSITGSISLPPSAAPALLCEVLSRLQEAEYDEDADGDEDVFRLTLKAGKAAISADDGAIRTITADFSPCVITFTDRS